MSTEFPTASELDALPVDACRAALAPLFEGAPRFVARLVAKRPFFDDQGLIDAAYEVARELPDREAVEMVNAHPPIGSGPAAMSAMSRTEQGYADDEAAESPAEEPWVDEELAGLNEVYEEHFGFRYIVFVGGRPRSAIIPLIEIGLRNDREAELRRAVADCVAIGEDRLRSLRGTAADEADAGAVDGENSQ